MKFHRVQLTQKITNTKLAETIFNKKSRHAEKYFLRYT
jgi:hypothetical protein